MITYAREEEPSKTAFDREISAFSSAICFLSVLTPLLTEVNSRDNVALRSLQERMEGVRMIEKGSRFIKVLEIHEQ